jgi:predicted lipid-binding transport protein (Tim44 family)
MKLKKFTIIFLSACIVLSQTALAARMGGGKSRGMQRSISSTQYNNTRNTFSNQQYQQPQPQYNVQQHPRQGIGTGTAAVLGAAAGAAGGYMLGKSAAEQNTKQIASDTISNKNQEVISNAQNHIPWGTIGILGALLLLGLMFFRKKASHPEFSGNNNNNANSYNHSRVHNPRQPSFNIPKINRQQARPVEEHDKVNSNNVQNVGNNIPARLDRMPDGVETIYFLRQAKGMFLHVQSMNNKDNASEVEKYMTPELYLTLKDEITANNFIADFPKLDCQLLSCEVNGNQIIASVKFFGTVSDEPTQEPKPFIEIWNFIKPDININRWLIAGIQQQQQQQSQV